MNFKKPLLSLGVAAYLFAAASNAAAFTPAQNPLFIGADVPGNLVLVPSVEWPTIVSVANIQPTYTPNEEFVGYFDSDKCYEYRYSGAESERHFYPTGNASGRQCSGEWSGNFLNWAATQTIDPFRKVLTGGLRVRDTATETWLEKARHTGQGGTDIYPNRSLSGSALIAGATPFTGVNTLQMRIQGLGNRMRFRLDNTNVGSGTPFDPAVHPNSGNPGDQAYDVVARVAVCVPGLLEDNCEQYGSNYKPEGLIQSSSDRLRFSIFGYLNHTQNAGRDGAVMRARQKFVGPRLPGGATNLNAEWNAATGVFVQNPDPNDAAATNSEFGITITRSGVINYLNQFGQLTNNNHKSQDPVSELFYAAVRYMRGEPNIPQYSDMTNNQARNADGFPVITDWFAGGHDPIQFSCQINVALGIGDIYTHRDKNLPGPTSGNDEPPKPALVANDNWINAVEVTNRVGAMEGIGNIGSGGSFSGRNNSAYIAGLAYWANTTDMRPGSPGVTTMSTHWVDVLEAQSLEGMRTNQYALAAKYGGADVPDTFDPLNDNLQTSWWHTNGETLTPFGRGNGDPSFLKPDNYYTAGNAADMVESLSDAFETILNETSNIVAAVSTTSTRLDTDTIAIQARFETEFWEGELDGLDPLTNAVQWRASSQLPAPGSRNIITWDRTGDTERPFNSSLPTTVADRIVAGGNGQSANDLINFIRGDRSLEGTPGFRTRGSHVLGDIVNSRPKLAGKLNEGWSRLSGQAGTAYPGYIDPGGRKGDRADVIYVGANDGMLHGFNAETGAEVMAYIPYSVQPKLGALANPTYQHEFFVDGQLAIGDAYDGVWKTVLVGGLGAGGRGLYALDITTPGNPDVLWEFTDEDDADLGFTFGEPVITRTSSGKWVAIFGNGYGSDNGLAYLYVVDLFNGTVLDKELVGPAGGGNGLSGVAAFLDPVSQTFVTRVYAGDLNGTMWRFDLSDDDAEERYANGLFTTPGNRPITVTPGLAASPNGGVFVYFGTGKLLETGDRAVPGTDENFWAVLDTNSAISGTSGFGQANITISGGNRVITGAQGSDGWYLPLDVASSEGERVLNKARLIFGRLVFSTFEPDDDACSTGGIQRLYVLDALSGEGLLDDVCPNCGVIEIGTGAPVEPPVVLKPAQPPAYTPPGAGDPPPVDPSVPPGVDPTRAREGWCSEFGILSPATGFLPLGTLCDGRQVWRQPR
mgnify:CR=1 FL=1